MKDSIVQFDHLPDEILLHIFRKLSNVDALFYLIDVNQRLNRLLHDPIFTSNCCLLVYDPEKKSTSPLPDIVLHRFCSTVLPQIGHRIKTLFIEGTSINCTLCASTYSNLYDLALYNMEIEAAKSLFVDGNFFRHISKNKISRFSISFTMPKDGYSIAVYRFIFTEILVNFPNLRCLKFQPYSKVYSCSVDFNGLAFRSSFSTIISSTLLELHVRVRFFHDCLYLLDGRFDQLRAFYVATSMIILDYPLPIVDKKMLLPNLRVFSFTCYDKVEYNFDELVVPLLQRMVNLEELELFFEVKRSEGFLDGNTLKKDILNHMPRLNKFTFTICSIVYYYDRSYFPSEESIQKSFECYDDQDIRTCINHFQKRELSQCLIYSYPYQLTFYNNLSNHFSDGLFPNVTKVSLYDEQPFEYEFFVRIAQSFPFMKDLIIKNGNAQNGKDLLSSTNNNQTLPIIRYPNLTFLDVGWTHDDYVELFLLDTKVFFSNDLHLQVDYQALKRVTYNLTRDATRNNCQKVAFLCTLPEVFDESIKNYFPHTRNDCL